jgi:hypothetical protein
MLLVLPEQNMVAVLHNAAHAPYIWMAKLFVHALQE